MEKMADRPDTGKMLLPNAWLLGEVERLLEDGQNVTLKATGNSMLPFITGGRDTVTLQPPQAPLQAGQIVLAHLPEERYVLHRILHTDGTNLVLMGDGNLSETESCHRNAVKGVVTSILRNGHTIDIQTKSEQRKAKAWQRMLPVRRYLLFIYKRIWRI